LGQKVEGDFKPPADTCARRLQGACILVVEDEVIIAMEIAASLEDEGAIVIGPAHTLRSAVAMASGSCISAAILDLRLRGASVTPVARLLSDRGVPFIFYSGQSRPDPIMAEWPESKIFPKPTSPSVLIGALARAISHDTPQSPLPSTLVSGAGS
jgi:DNA-binding NtrC family response regulator